MNASIPLNWKLTYLFNSQKTQFVTQSSILKIPQLHTFPTEVASKIQHNDGINNIFSAENSKKPLEYEIDLENVKKLCVFKFFLYILLKFPCQTKTEEEKTHREKKVKVKRGIILYCTRKFNFTFAFFLLKQHKMMKEQKKMMIKTTQFYFSS